MMLYRYLTATPDQIQTFSSLTNSRGWRNRWLQIFRLKRIGWRKKDLSIDQYLPKGGAPKICINCTLLIQVSKCFAHKETLLDSLAVSYVCICAYWRVHCAYMHISLRWTKRGNAMIVFVKIFMNVLSALIPFYVSAYVQWESFTFFYSKSSEVKNCQDFIVIFFKSM